MSRLNLQKQNKAKQMRKSQVHQNYLQRIVSKQAEVEQNEHLIHKLSQKEKQSLYTLKDTLSRENQVDTQLAYDIHGCPNDWDFSEKNYGALFDLNMRKSIKMNSRPQTATLYGARYLEHIM